MVVKSGTAQACRNVGRLASFAKDGGCDRDRTCDPYHVKVVLFR
jgi:hypothetical protein